MTNATTDELKAAIQRLDDEAATLRVEVRRLTDCATEAEVNAALNDQPPPAEVASWRARIAEATQRLRAIAGARVLAAAQHDARVQVDNGALVQARLQALGKACEAEDEACRTFAELLQDFEARLLEVRHAAQRRKDRHREASALIDAGLATFEQVRAAQPARVCPPAGTVMHSRDTGLPLPQWTSLDPRAALWERLSASMNELALGVSRPPEFLHRFRLWRDARGGASAGLDLDASDALNERLIEEA